MTMMTAHHPDWQTIASLLIVVTAGVYLLRRWWPGFKGLLAPTAAAQAPRQSDQGACGKPLPMGDAAMTAPASSCAAGCGNCGQGQAPAKDHRVHIVQRGQHSA